MHLAAAEKGAGLAQINLGNWDANLFISGELSDKRGPEGRTESSQGSSDQRERKPLVRRAEDAFPPPALR